MRMIKMDKAGRLAVALLGVCLCSTGRAQVTAPVLPPAVARYALFGGDAVGVNGSVVVQLVTEPGGAPIFGGHIASNGDIQINGNNTIAGDATPGPGHLVRFNGGTGQVQGSTAPAAAALPLEEQNVDDWAAYAQANHNNAAIPSRFLDGQRNLTINGSRTCTLPAGTYYVNNVTVNGSGRLVVTGPVTFVCTGALTINGNCRVNYGGAPSDLLFVLATASPVTLNGTARVNLTLYAPRSSASLNGSFTACGWLWARAVNANGTFTWNRLKDTTAPSLSIVQPPDGAKVATDRPLVAFTYEDGRSGTGVNIQSLSVQLDGVEIVSSLTVTGTGATGQAPSPLADGPHALAVTLADYEGNSASAASAFSTDTVPPAIAISGVSEGGLYGAAVTPVITVTDDHLDAASVQITLDGTPFVSGTAVAAEGGHALHVQASDTYGNHAEAAVHFAQDLTPPAIAVSGVSEGAVYGAAVTPVFSVTDPHLDDASVRATLNGQPFTSGTPVEREGEYTLAVSAADTLGHTIEQAVHFSLDLTPPAIEVTGVSDGELAGHPVSAQVSVTDAHLDAASIQIALNGQPYASGTEIAVDGAYTLHVAAADLAGHTAETTIAFTVDTEPPAIAITGVQDGEWANLDVVPAVTVTDPHLDPASVQITLNGQAFTSGTPVTEEGYYLLSVAAADLAGHSAQQTVAFAVDKTAPEIQVSTPPDNGITKENPVTLSGAVLDAHPENLTVNGEAVGSPGQSSFSVPVPLAEGPNAIALHATDRAGNGATLEWHVTLKTTPPSVAIGLPLSGTVTRDAAVNVEGTVSEDAVQVLVGQAPSPAVLASIVNGTFTAGQVPLQEGTNTLTAVATDAAGNAASAAVQVTRDSRPPVIQVTSPADGAHTSAPSITVAGTVGDASPFTATLNGGPLSVTAGAFSQEVALTAGTNWITLSVVDSAGNAAERSLSVVRESGPFTVASIVPQSGASGVSPAASITVDFNREVKESTLTAAAFRVSVGGQDLPGALVYHGSRVVYLPSAGYGTDALVSVSLASSLTDLAGTPLEPFGATFTTLAAPAGGPAPLSLALNPLPALTRDTSLTVSGATAPGGAVTLSGGAAPVTATAGGDGLFTASLPLASDALNTFTATASLAGASTSPQSFSVVQDSTPPFVTGFQVEGDDILCDFSEAIDPESLTVETVRLSRGGAGVLVTPSLENAGTRLRITPDEPIGAAAAALTLTTGIRDLAGNSLASPFTRTFNGGATGQAFLEGEVYDDTTGLPLPGALAELTEDASGSVFAGGGGAWALPVPARAVTVHLSAPGYTDAYRRASPSTGTIAMVLDARLTPLSPEPKTLGSDGGTFPFGGGTLVLEVPPGALPDGSTANVTALSPQGLPFPLPAGFSPLAAYRVDLSAAPSQPLTLRVPVPSGAGASIPTALFDPSERAWVGQETATTGGSQTTVTLPVAQAPPPVVLVLLRPDAAPLSSPPEVTPGQVLAGLSEVPLDASAAVLETVPSTITPSQKAEARLGITPSAPVPSGLPFQVTFTESLDIREGTGTATQRYTPYTEDLFAYQDAADPAQMAARFPVSPFPGIDVVTLLMGRIDLAAGAYDATPLGGGIFDPQSGQAMEVDGGGGTHAVIPAGGASAPLPVRIFPVPQSSLLAPIPEGFTFLGGVEVNLGGGSLILPATLGLDLSSLAAPLEPTEAVLVVKAATVAGVATYTATDLGGINTATARLESASAGSPWPQVLGEGRYVFLKADGPIGFVTGRVLTPQAQAIAGAAVGLTGSVPWNAVQRDGGSEKKEFTAEAQRARRTEVSGARPFSGGRGAVSGASSASSASQRLKTRIEALVKAGQAPQAALLLVDLAGITSVSGADGSYIVPAPLSAVTVKAVDVRTADAGEAQAAPSEAQPTAQRDVVITPSPIAVVSASPADGATGVPVGASVVVTFSKVVAPASVTASAFEVVVVSGGQAPSPVTGSAQVVLGGKTVVFTPDGPWPAGGSVSVTLSGVTDRLGQEAAAVTFGFTVAAPPPVRLDPGAIEARLPDESGRICVEGGPGAVEGLAAVYLVNSSRPEYGTVTLTANPDGSFTACIAGAVGDTIEVHVVGASGGERVYSLSQLVSADHLTTSMGPRGGTFTAPLPDGTSVTLQVPEGAFDGPATLSVHPADPAQTAPVPQGFAAGAPVSIEMSRTAQKEIALILEAPAGWNLDDPSKQYWLVKTVTWGPENTKSPMVLDTLRPTPCPGNPAGRCLITQSPPFQGLRESAVVQVYQAPASWGFVSGQVVLSDFMGHPLLITNDATPFVYVLDQDLRYVLPLPVPPAQMREPATTFGISAVDLFTWQVVFTQGGLSFPTVPGAVTNIGVATDDHTPPFPIQALPFDVKVVPITALHGNVTDLIGYDVTDADGSGTVTAGDQVTLVGSAGAAAPGQPVQAFNVTQAGSPLASATAGPDGSFTLQLANLRGGKPGDVILISMVRDAAEPSALLQIVFSKPVAQSSGDSPIKIEKLAAGGPVAVAAQPVWSSNRQVATFENMRAWEAGATYRVTFPGLRDLAGDRFPQNGFACQFTVRDDLALGTLNQSLSLVRDMVKAGSLLFVACAETHQENGVEVKVPGIAVVDVSNPLSPRQVEFVALNFEVWGLTITKVPAPVKDACPQSDPNTLLPVLAAVGGGEGERGGGQIFAYQILDRAPWLQWLGANELCCSLHQYCENEPSGMPFQVEAFGPNGFISTMGVGLQNMDLTTLCRKNTQPPAWTGASSKEDIRSLVQSLAKIETSEEHTLLLPLLGGSLRILDVSTTAPRQVADVFPGRTPFTSGRLGVDTALALPVFPPASSAPVTKDLAFVADGTNGVAMFLLQGEQRSSSIFLGRFTLAGGGSPAPSASDVSVDSVNRLLYVTTTGGLWVYDIGHMAWVTNKDGSIQAPVPSFVLHDRNFQGPRAPVIDPYTGLAFSLNAEAKLGVYQMGKPKVAFIEAGAGDPYAVIPLLQPSDTPDVRLAVWLPGGVGQQIEVSLRSLTLLGATPPAGSPGPQPSATLLLLRQSNDISDKRYNLYLSAPLILTANPSLAPGTAPALLVSPGGTVTIVLPQYVAAFLSRGSRTESLAPNWLVHVFGVKPYEIKVEEKDPEFPESTLAPDTYYPAMGDKTVTLTATMLGMPLASPNSAVTARVIAPASGASVTLVDAGKVTNGRAEITLRAQGLPPTTPPTNYSKKWVRPEDPTDPWTGSHIEVEFSLTVDNKTVAVGKYKWKVITNKVVVLKDVLDGKAVWTYVDLGTGSPLQKDDHLGASRTTEDPVVNGAWNSPFTLEDVPSEDRTFNFAQFLLNEVVPRKRTIATARGEDAYVFLHEDGLYGDATVKAVHQFKDPAKGFHLGKNTKAEFSVQAYCVGYGPGDDTSAIFRKMTKDYGLRTSANAAGRWLDKILDKDTLVVGAYNPEDTKINDGTATKDTGLWELYRNVVRPFTEKMLERAYQYSVGSASAWTDRVGHEHFAGEGISYCWFGKQTLERFNSTVSRCQAPSSVIDEDNDLVSTTVPSAYSGKLKEEDCKDGSGTRRYPGLYGAEENAYEGSPTGFPQFDIFKWAGIDCSGFVQRCTNTADALYSTDFSLKIKVGIITGDDGHPSPLLRARDFFNTPGILARYDLATEADNGVKTSDSSKGPRRGDCVGYINQQTRRIVHITFVWKSADSTGKYEIIHAAGQDKWAAPGATAGAPGWRKVTRMPQSYGLRNDLIFGRVILWN